MVEVVVDIGVGYWNEERNEDSIYHMYFSVLPTPAIAYLVLFVTRESL